MTDLTKTERRIRTIRNRAASVIELLDFDGGPVFDLIETDLERALQAVREELNERAIECDTLSK